MVFLSTLTPERARGFVLAALAAAFYGTKPVFAVPLYAEGMNSLSVMLFRYLLAAPILAALMLRNEERLLLDRTQWLPICLLGVLLALSSLAIYEAYRHISPGVASTLLFVYPVLTALLMSLFFHEKNRGKIAVCLTVMGCGVYLLAWSPTGEVINPLGVSLAILSAASYALYLVLARVSRTAQTLAPIKSLFWQMVMGGAVYITLSAILGVFTMPSSLGGWICQAALAVLPTMLSLLCTLWAIDLIGATPTAIFGALEPVAAVLLGALFLADPLTPREILGGALIVCATLLVMGNINSWSDVKKIFSG